MPIDTLNKNEFVDQMTRIAVQCYLQNKQMVFWQYHSEVFDCLVREGLLEKMEFRIVDDREPFQGRTVLNTEIESPSILHDFRPPAVLILDQSDPAGAYETLLETYHFPPDRLHAPVSMWEAKSEPIDPLFHEALAAVPPQIKGGLSAPQIAIHLYDSLRYLIGKPLAGDIVNLGVYQGWSCFFVAWLLKRLGDSRCVWGFDSFAGFGTATERDVFCQYQCNLGKTGWNFFKDTSLELCRSNLRDFDNITLIPGDIAETIGQLPDRPLALALFDMDDYTPTQVALEPVYDRLVTGGLIIQDH